MASGMARHADLVRYVAVVRAASTSGTLYCFPMPFRSNHSRSRFVTDVAVWQPTRGPLPAGSSGLCGEGHVSGCAIVHAYMCLPQPLSSHGQMRALRSTSWPDGNVSVPSHRQMLSSWGPLFLGACTQLGLVLDQPIASP